MNKITSLTKEKYYIYILFSLKDSKFYVGYSANLKQRLADHFSGKVTATKHRLPLKLLHYEYFIDKEDAEARERFYKSGFGRQQLREALKRTLKNI